MLCRHTPPATYVMVLTPAERDAVLLALELALSVAAGDGFDLVSGGQNQLDYFALDVQAVKDRLDTVADRLFLAAGPSATA